MAIDPINSGSNSSPLHDSLQNLHHSVSEEKGEEKKTTREQDAVSLRFAASAIGRLDSINSEKHNFAVSIRETDKALQGVSKVVSDMRENLETIVKRWPPFSRESAEREELLKGYVSLNKLIEELTIPPPPQPFYENNAELWDGLVSGGSAEAVTELSVDSPDEQVQAALTGLESLQSAIDSGRSELARAITA